MRSVLPRHARRPWSAPETPPGSCPLSLRPPRQTRRSASCTAFLAHLTPPGRARFEHQVVALSAIRPVYWISAETRADPAAPRPRLARCENGTVTGHWALARYQSHGAWLQWTAGGPALPSAAG